MIVIVTIICIIPQLIYEFKLIKKYYRKGKWLEEQISDYKKGEWVLDPEDNTPMIQHRIMINCNIFIPDNAINLVIKDCSFLDTRITTKKDSPTLNNK